MIILRREKKDIKTTKVELLKMKNILEMKTQNRYGN